MKQKQLLFKRMALLSIILLASAYQTFGNGWYNTSQSNCTSFLKLKMIDNNTGFAIANNGCVVKTTDGGNNWFGIYSPSQLDNLSSTDLDFVSASVGYIVGYNASVIKTIDGGRTWDEISIPNAGGTTFLCVDFTDANTGYIAGVGGVVYKTTDGGKNWTESAAQGADIYHIQIVNANTQTGHISLSNGQIRKTTNGGNTWTTQITGVPGIRDMHFLPSNPNYGWFITNDKVYGTTNGGSNWTLKMQDTTLRTFVDIHFTSTTTGYLVRNSQGANTSNDDVYKTTDGGNTWTAQNSNFAQLARSIFFFEGSNTGYLTTDYMGILKSTDGGATWPRISQVASQSNMYGISFAPSSTTGWYVGLSGQVFKSTNGGEVWARTQTGINGNIDLYSVYAISTNTVFVCGTGGAIRKTTDGASNWTTVTSNVTTALYDIRFFDANNGLCVGDQGKVLRTTDGGATWTVSTVAANNAIFRGIYYASSTNVFIVGHGGLLYKSTDGGATWGNLTSGVTSNLLGVFFTSTTTGYICGAGNVIRKTTDGGSTWTALSTGIAGTAVYFTKMVFTSANNGWAVGRDGTIIRTRNAGTTWKNENKFTQQIINAVTSVNSNELIACAQVGFLGKYKETCPPAVPSSYTGNTTICSGTSTLLTAKGEGVLGWYSASSGGSYLGAGESFTTPTLNANTTYYVQDSTCSASARLAISVTVTQPPTVTVTPASRCGNGIVTLGATPSNGIINWYAASSGGASIATGNSYTTPSLSSSTTYYVDATTNEGCTSTSRSAVTATINAIPTINSTTPGSRCGSGTVSLSASGSGTSLNWYAANSGGASLASGGTFTTGTISTTTIYYVDATANGCTTAARTAVTASIIAVPTITSTTPGGRCGTGTVTLQATPSGGVINWYTANSGGASLGSSISYTTPSIASTTTYYVDATANGCTTTSRTAVQAVVNSIPTISNTSPANRCGEGSVTLSATPSAGFVNWYAASSGGSALLTNNQFSSPSISTTTTYYAEALSQQGCASTPRTAVVATIKSVPSITSAISGQRCGNGTVNLAANPDAGTVNWYASIAGGSALATGTSYTTPSLSSTTNYYVDATLNGCTTAARETVTASINTVPTILSTKTGGTCGRTTAVLEAYPSEGRVYWYDASGLIDTGRVFITPPISSTTTYSAEAVSNQGCASATKVAVTASLTAGVDVSLSLSGNTISTVDQNGASYQWENCANNTLLSNEINGSYTATQIGNYRVIISLQNGCVDTSDCENLSVLGIDNSLTMATAITVYPNPNSGSFNIQSANEGNYYIINSLGQIIKTLQLNATNNNAVSIDGIQSGVYYLIGKDFNDTPISKKIVVTQ
jgi:photosystem II stability/assembly factor-like uncharacterized protein